jgi:hypothetical protein
MSFEGLTKLWQGKCIYCNVQLPKGYRHSYCKKCGKEHRKEIKQLNKHLVSRI